MLECEKCSRKSPPARSACLYCGAPLAGAVDRSRPIRKMPRILDEWEKGFNVVVKPIADQTGRFERVNVEEIAAELDLVVDDLIKLFSANVPFPAARVESSAEAEAISAVLREYGVETEVVADQKLGLSSPQKRVRAVAIKGGSISFTLFNTGDLENFSSEDLKLIVTGSVFEKTIETVEKHSKKHTNKTLNIGHTARDQRMIDVYAGNEMIGYRIIPTGFDFSALGAEMSILATENLQKLFVKLSNCIANGEAINGYDEIRNSLTNIWSFEEVNSTKGVTKKGVGNVNVARQTIVTNLNQFTRFSRLCRQFI